MRRGKRSRESFAGSVGDAAAALVRRRADKLAPLPEFVNLQFLKRIAAPPEVGGLAGVERLQAKYPGMFVQTDKLWVLPSEEPIPIPDPPCMSTQEHSPRKLVGVYFYISHGYPLVTGGSQSDSGIGVGAARSHDVVLVPRKGEFIRDISYEERTAMIKWMAEYYRLARSGSVLMDAVTKLLKCVPEPRILVAVWPELAGLLDFPVRTKALRPGARPRIPKAPKKYPNMGQVFFPEDWTPEKLQLPNTVLAEAMMLENEFTPTAEVGLSFNIIMSTS
jgi:hypothetical protein